MTVETGYLLTLALSIEDADPLWHAAATLAMASPGMTMDDVTDTIGPRAAPNVEDCLALLLQPERFTGCAVTALDIIKQRRSVAAGQRRAAASSKHYRPFDMLGAVHPTYRAATFETASSLD